MDLKNQLGPKIWDLNRDAVLYTIGDNGVNFRKKNYV